ncbi:tRNA dihydrouridine(20/20a) synthase DusA [Hansschlegelia sp. KR7-227]|uniref:tRNA dihydrouridine(20/20a) synthase DusA n=1 Tax=Hansschlegelia sp. KR7-227 TaxID=3400914 RepID=UPI003C0BC993
MDHQRANGPSPLIDRSPSLSEPSKVSAARRFSVAPMMDWTDRHCRLFHRSLTRRALLYTEMVTTGAVRFGPRERLLGFSAEEQPVAVQLGGSEPQELAEAARICEDFGYAEVNLNVGCPSDRVQDGRFGACLMAEPERVAASVAAMKAAVAIPVTVKCRIGIDDQDPEEALDALADAVVAAGCDALIVHARKAWLKGLSPRENRDVPPLDYDRVFRLKARFPALPVSINGGIGSLDEAIALLRPRDGVTLDGVMLGRAAYQNPELLLGVDALVFGAEPSHAHAREAVTSLFPAISQHLAKGGRLSNVTRHMLGLFAGKPGARAYRRLLSEQAPREGAGLDVLARALDLVDDREIVSAAA